MACYVDEDQVWKCPNHPSSKRRRTGICPSCLRDRLITLCPECANTRPCACTPSDSTSTSSSSSSSFQYSRAGSLRHAEFGRMSNLIENEPAFRKSRSVSFPFLRSISKSKHAFSGGGDQSTLPLPRVSRSKISFWSVFKLSKTKKCDLHYDESSNKSEYSSPASVKRRGWYIPSPMKAFMHSKTTKLHIHERSPMHRG
ncbi:uncharacterized protein LOC143610030 [Bidens hawaiensis]|uniref:uncharacterized protein LOC143610030 n=1 Tax=Bidens hawaiensis TaxID=980011 RepID=UPI00404A600B